MLLQPLPGNAGGLEAIAHHLDGSAARFLTLGTVARELGRGAVWDGPAGEAFGAELAQLGPVLQRVEERYTRAAQELRALAPDIDRAQRVVAAAIAQAKDANAQIAALEERIVTAMTAGAEWGSIEALSLRRAQQQQVARVRAAEADHARAWSDFEAADARCAAALRAVAGDDVADPTFYRFLHRTRSIAETTASVGAIVSLPGVKQLVSRAPVVGAVTAVAGWVALAAETGLTVVYDEGSWAVLAAGAAGTVVGFGGGALKRGATAGSVRTVRGQYISVHRFTAGQRARIGVRAEAAERRDAFVKELGAKPRNPSLRGKSPGLVEGFHLARASRAVPMYVAGVTLEKAPKVIEQAQTARTRVQELEARREEKREQPSPASW